MTAAQASYLKTLCQEAGQEFDPDLTKAQASERIDELQKATGRRHRSLREIGSLIGSDGGGHCELAAHCRKP
jgi:hypothetical protein